MSIRSNTLSWVAGAEKSTLEAANSVSDPVKRALAVKAALEGVYSGHVLSLKGDTAHPSTVSVVLDDGTVVESVSVLQISRPGTAKATAGPPPSPALGHVSDSTGKLQIDPKALEALGKLAIAAAGSGKRSRKLQQRIRAVLRLLPPDLIALASGVQCDCLCPVPGHSTLRPDDCGEVARIDYEEAQANSRLGDEGEPEGTGM